LERPPRLGRLGKAYLGSGWLGKFYLGSNLLKFGRFKECYLGLMKVWVAYLGSTF
jgi:hypothetical protein